MKEIRSEALAHPEKSRRFSGLCRGKVPEESSSSQSDLCSSKVDRQELLEIIWNSFCHNLDVISKEDSRMCSHAL